MSTALITTPDASESAAVRELARDFFTKEVAPLEPKFIEQGYPDRSVYRRAGDLGLLCMSIPEEYGGGGGTFAYEAILFEEQIRSGDSAMQLGVHTGIVPHYILAYGTEEQKQRWLPKLASGEWIGAIAMTEPGTGSDLQAISTRAAKSGDGYLVSGAKTFISNGRNCDLVIIAAKTDPEARASGLSLLIAEVSDDTPGFERGRVLDKIGQKGQDTAELFFDNLRIPAENLLGPDEGRGFVQLMEQLPNERLICAVASVAMMEHAVEVTTAYTKERNIFGKPLMAMQTPASSSPSVPPSPASHGPSSTTASPSSSEANSTSPPPRWRSTGPATSSARSSTAACSCSAATGTPMNSRLRACSPTASAEDLRRRQRGHEGHHRPFVVRPLTLPRRSWSFDVPDPRPAPCPAVHSRGARHHLRRSHTHVPRTHRSHRSSRSRSAQPRGDLRRPRRDALAQQRPLRRIPPCGPVGRRCSKPRQHPVEPRRDRLLAQRFGHEGTHCRRRVRGGHSRSARACPDLGVIIHAGENDAPEGAVSYEELIATHEPVEDARRSGDELAGIFYTGGTTGFPKGVMLSHTNMVTSAAGTVATGELLSGDARFLHAAPMFHLADLAAWAGQVMLGGPHIIVPFFEPVAVLKAIEQYRPTDVLLVPTMLQLLVDHPSVSEYDLSAMQRILYGGSPIGEGLANRILTMFPGVRMTQAYGMTEVAPVASLLLPDDHRGATLRSGGQAAPHSELRIVDTGGNPVPTGTVGEICVRGGHVMQGYWNKPAETAAVLRDGWYHTGDGGYLDENGFVFVVDRLKDMIVTGGENVYSAEVESA